MADMMSTLRGFLGDGADDKIKTAMNMLSQSGLLQSAGQQSGNQQPVEKLNEVIKDIKPESESESVNVPKQTAQNNISPMLTPEGLQFLGQIKNMVDQVSNTNDSRSDLLRSLKPFMRSERQRSIDRAIRVINIGRFSGLFGK